LISSNGVKRICLLIDASPDTFNTESSSTEKRISNNFTPKDVILLGASGLGAANHLKVNITENSTRQVENSPI
jgi:hypothetical protein